MTSDLCTRPIADSDIHGAVVMACSVEQLAELVERLEQQLQAQGRVIEVQFQVLKAFADLYTELTDETEQRAFLRKSILKAEREAARLTLPLWFWKYDQHGEFKRQLLERARFLIYDRKATVDDQWTLLNEWASDAGQELPEEMLKGCIKYAHENRGGY